MDSRQTVSLTARIRDHIERMILAGEVGAGERLNENALAAELNVSRGPIREVTRQLAEAGLLTIIRNRGAFVRTMNLEDVLHIYDVRAGLARVAGRLAAINATTKQIAELKDLWKKMQEIQEKKRFEEYYNVNREFHVRIFEIANNPRLSAFEESTEREASLYLRRGVIGKSRLGTSNKQHAQILEAIERHDEVAAARAFENHILSGKRRMLDNLTSASRRPGK